MSLHKYTKQVACLSPRATIYDASQAMKSKGIGAIIVVSDDDKPIGILTDRDIVMRVVAAQLRPETATIEDAMSRDLVALREDATIRRATEVMREKGVRRIPIVDAQGRVTGIVSLDDLLVEIGLEIGNLAQGIVSGLTRPAEVEAAAWQERA